MVENCQLGEAHREEEGEDQHYMEDYTLPIVFHIPKNNDRRGLFTNGG